ncbi:hypothetical protein PR048_008159 [Dryococelus australis]|uniref:Uncharacterized protein n=1 Tax=Dryococelus australis TaxID=614101 RepID=A0ABQ9HWM4_9NEOP|nr:hypothetical protein PR048_008159 [Dryococelus australis]
MTSRFSCENDREHSTANVLSKATFPIGKRGFQHGGEKPGPLSARRYADDILAPSDSSSYTATHTLVSSQTTPRSHTVHVSEFDNTLLTRHGDIWAALNTGALRADGGKSGAAPECQGGETGDPRENTMTSGIVRHDSHVRKFVWATGHRTKFALVGSERSSHCAELRTQAYALKLRRNAVQRQQSEKTYQTKVTSTTFPLRRARSKKIVNASRLRSRDDVVVRLLACSPPTEANRVRFPAGSLPDFRMQESCRMMPLMGGFSRGSPVSPLFIPALLHIHLNSPSSTLKTSAINTYCYVLQLAPTQLPRAVVGDPPRPLLFLERCARGLLIPLAGKPVNNGQRPVGLSRCSELYLLHGPSPLLGDSTGLATTQECSGETGWRLSPPRRITRGHLKALVYATPMDDVGTLRKRIVAGFQTIRNFPGIHQRILVSMQRRVDTCVSGDGGHFKHFL